MSFRHFLTVVCGVTLIVSYIMEADKEVLDIFFAYMVDEDSYAKQISSFYIHITHRIIFDMS